VVFHAGYQVLPESGRCSGQGCDLKRFETRVREARQANMEAQDLRQKAEQDLGLMTQGIPLRLRLRRTWKAEGKNRIQYPEFRSQYNSTKTPRNYITAETPRSQSLTAFSPIGRRRLEKEILVIVPIMSTIVPI